MSGAAGTEELIQRFIAQDLQVRITSLDAELVESWPNGRTLVPTTPEWQGA